MIQIQNYIKLFKQKKILYLKVLIYGFFLKYFII